MANTSGRTLHGLYSMQEQINQIHRPVNFSGTEIKELHQEIFEMLGEPKYIKIRNWEIQGKLDSFDDDVIVGNPKMFINHLRGRK